MTDSTGGLGVFRVGVDVAAQFTGQIGGLGEDTTGNDVALHLREIQLDLVQPARVSLHEADGGFGMLLEELVHISQHFLLVREILLAENRVDLSEPKDYPRCLSGIVV